MYQMSGTPNDVPDVWQAEEEIHRYSASGSIRKILHDLELTEVALWNDQVKSCRLFSAQSNIFQMIAC